MLFITKAYAQATESLAELEAQIPPLPDAPSSTEIIFQNLMVIGILVFLFYVLLIMPQQKRFKEHSKMLNELKKGDRVVTGGGLIGVIEKISDDKDEVVINLGETTVTALRSTIQVKDDPRLRQKPANDAKDAKAEKDTKAEKKAAEKKVDDKKTEDKKKK